MAPTATASASGPPRTIATTGTVVSGSAVPSAASRLPVAPAASFRRNPAHSTALVKSSAATTMSTSPPTKRPAVVTR